MFTDGATLTVMPAASAAGSRNLDFVPGCVSGRSRGRRLCTGRGGFRQAAAYRVTLETGIHFTHTAPSIPTLRDGLGPAGKYCSSARVASNALYFPGISKSAQLLSRPGPRHGREKDTRAPRARGARAARRPRSSLPNPASGALARSLQQCARSLRRTCSPC